MRKRLCLMGLAVLMLLGCAKTNPTNEELTKTYSESDALSTYVKEIIEYSASDDPDQLLGGNHQYIQKLGIIDNRYTSGGNDPAVFIEIFNNTQDAQIRYDYLSLINESRTSFADKNGLIIEGKNILKEAPVHLNGNIVMKASDRMGANVADSYFRELDQLLSDAEYKQEGTVSEEEYETLHQALVEDKKTDIEKEISREAETSLKDAEDAVAAVLKKFESELSDTNYAEAEKIIKTTYGGKYFNDLRTGWQKKLDELNALKEANEEEYQTVVDEIAKMLAEAENNPNLDQYNACEEAVRNVEDNYYYQQFRSGWDKQLKAIKEAALLAERDKNVKKINSKLDELEKSIDLSLYEEVEKLIGDVRNDSLYKDYIGGWNDRMDALKDEVEVKKHKAEIKAFKDTCKKYSYKEFSRNSEELKGKPVYFKGEVVQVVDQDSEGAELRMNVTKQGSYYTYYTDTIYVVYDNSDEISTTKILEDDIIEIWGLAAGDVSYTTVLGSKLTIPAVLAKYIKVK